MNSQWCLLIIFNDGSTTKEYFDDCESCNAVFECICKAKEDDANIMRIKNNMFSPKDVLRVSKFKTLVL